MWKIKVIPIACHTQKYITDGFKSYSQSLNPDSLNHTVGEGLKNEKKTQRNNAHHLLSQNTT